MSASEAVPIVVLVPSTDGTAANGNGSTISLPRNNANTIQRTLMGWVTATGGGTVTAKLQGSPDGILWQDLTSTITLGVSPNTNLGIGVTATCPYVRAVVAGALAGTTGTYVVLC